MAREKKISEPFMIAGIPWQCLVTIIVVLLPAMAAP